MHATLRWNYLSWSKQKWWLVKIQGLEEGWNSLQHTRDICKWAMGVPEAVANISWMRESGERTQKKWSKLWLNTGCIMDGRGVKFTEGLLWDISWKVGNLTGSGKLRMNWRKTGTKNIWERSGKWQKCMKSD